MRNAILGLLALAAIGCEKETPECYSALPCNDTRLIAAEDGRVSYARRQAGQNTLKLAVIVEEHLEKRNEIEWAREDYKVDEGVCAYACFSESIRIESRAGNIEHTVLLVDLGCDSSVDKFYSSILRLDIYREQMLDTAPVDAMLDEFKNKLVGMAYNIEDETMQWIKAREM